jgi:predicted DCC family thiol-disulfide oxidoreductase YuxK
MEQNKARIRVYYDGACPQCVKDRRNYEKLSGQLKDDIQWIDITGKESLLRSMGIDPKKALMELHLEDENRQIFSEIDAYILLMRKVPVLKPLSIIIGLPLVRPMLSKVYHWCVNRRLRHTGRM